MIIFTSIGLPIYCCYNTMAWMPSETDVMTGETDVERRLVIGKLSNLIGLLCSSTVSGKPETIR